MWLYTQCKQKAITRRKKLVCRTIAVLCYNLLFWFVSITWSKWAQWEYKRRSGTVNNNYPIRNNNIMNWILKKLIILNYLNSKAVFFKTMSKSIIHNVSGELCISTVWCSKMSYWCWDFQTTNLKSWCNLEKGDNSNNWKWRMISSLQVSYKINFHIFVMFIVSAKIPEREGSILPSSFYGLPTNSHAC